MRTLATRAACWLHSRQALTGDRGQTTAEYLLLGAVGAGIIALVAGPGLEGIISGLITKLQTALGV